MQPLQLGKKKRGRPGKKDVREEEAEDEVRLYSREGYGKMVWLQPKPEDESAGSSGASSPSQVAFSFLSLFLKVSPAEKFIGIVSITALAAG